MKSTLSLSLLILVVLLALSASRGRGVRAQNYFCGEETICVNGSVYNTCIKTPTSLPSVDVHVAGDWYVDRPNSHCGAYRCYYLFACECGAPLSSRLCTSAEKNNA